MSYTITLIPGDGTGPDVTEAMRRVVEATGVAVEWDVQQAGEMAMAEHGTPLPEHVLESVRRNRVGIKGPITTPIGSGFRSVNVAIRKALDLYANLRPAKSFPGVRSAFSDVDLVIVRENTEGLYVGIEHDVIAGEAAEAIRIITRRGSERVVRFAFEYARENDGLFLEAARKVASEYPDIAFNDRIVDNMCMQLVQRPEEYDVLVLPNLFGDIVSDLASGLVGGLGVAPGANIGDGIAVFEPVHGSAPKYAGQNKVNPTATIQSAVLMLRYLGETDAADRVEEGIRRVIAEGTHVTYDMKADRYDPTAVGTQEMADAIIAAMP
jgi:isocitrate dehydrogenase (NAD+)